LHPGSEGYSDFLALYILCSIVDEKLGSNLLWFEQIASLTVVMYAVDVVVRADISSDEF